MGIGHHPVVAGDSGIESDSDCYTQGLEYRLPNYR
jgi:hypothetical protein